MSASRRKGTAFESALVSFLADHGWPHAERRALHGCDDRGDVAGTGPLLVWEAKACRAIDLAGFMDETEAERRNAGAEVGVLVVKRRQKSTGQAYAVVPLEAMTELLKRAGY